MVGVLLGFGSYLRRGAEVGVVGRSPCGTFSLPEYTVGCSLVSLTGETGGFALEKLLSELVMLLGEETFESEVAALERRDRTGMRDDCDCVFRELVGVRVVRGGYEKSADPCLAVAAAC